MKLINDPYFKITIDLNASSPNPAAAIWTAQHCCVSDEFAPNATIPANPAQAIIDNQLKPKHWSVLEFASVVLHFQGFPHDTVMQLVRHQGKNSPLVQSMRYTGNKMRRCGNGEFNTEELFYVMPAGSYPSRNGFYEFTESDRAEHLAECQLSAAAYSRAIAKGQPEELARRLLAAGYRQNFTMAGTIRSVFHWLDQRTLTDSQIEAQTLAWMTLDQLEQWERSSDGRVPRPKEEPKQPTLFGWYRQHRAKKNLLAP
jgi:thymidylate synthase (FAD)